MRISDWSSDVCSSDLCRQKWLRGRQQAPGGLRRAGRRLRLAPISPTLVSGLGAWQAEETPGLVERVAQTVLPTGARDEIEYGAMFAVGCVGTFTRRVAAMVLARQTSRTRQTGRRVVCSGRTRGWSI